MRRFLNNSVPVPEVFGWRTDGGETFIYMGYVRAKTLEEVWEVAIPENRLALCQELRQILKNLRRLKQDPWDTFVGK